MTTRSGLGRLVDAVRDYFVAEQVDASVAALGWREYRKIHQPGPGARNRVVFLPSDPKSGRGGKFLPQARNIGVQPRAVATIERDLLVSVWAVDRSSAEALASDLAQIEAVETLLESTVQAVRSFAHADATWGGFTWGLEPLEHAHGREILVELAFRGPLLWPLNNIVTPSVGTITRSLPVTLPEAP